MLDEVEFQALLNQINKNLAIAHNSFGTVDLIHEIHTSSNRLKNSDIEFTDAEDGEKIQGKIENIISQTYYNYRKSSGFNDNEIEEKEIILEKVVDQINKIKSKVGIFPQRFERQISNANDDYTKRYLPTEFIQLLTISIIENRIINEKFPIYIEKIDIKSLAPTPLKQCSDKNGVLKKEDTDEQRFLNQGISQLENQTTGIDTGIESRPSYEVTVYFYIKLEKLSDNLKSYIKNYKYKKNLRFSISSYGTGGQLTQITRIINNALFGDIKCIRDEYFPVAHDIIIRPEIIRNNISSPMSSTNLVKIYSREELKRELEIINQNRDSVYDSFPENMIAQGVYCGFDLLETIAKSLLQSRLKVLYQLKIDQDEYLKNLIKRNQEKKYVDKAKNFLTHFPFSLLAMEKYLQTTLFDPVINKPEPSYTQYNAKLDLIEEYLNQGFYCKACEYMQDIRNELDEYSKTGIEFFDQIISDEGSNNEEELNQNFKIFSGYTIAKYELLKANLYYLSTPNHTNQSNDSCSVSSSEDGDCVKCLRQNMRRLSPHRSKVEEHIHQTLDALQNSLKHLHLRYQKYVIVKEYSQGTFYPYYLILAKNYFLKAQLFTFFPKTITDWIGANPNQNNMLAQFKIPTLEEFNLDNQSQLEDDLRREAYYNFCRIYCLEKARIYAARSGDTELYACYCAYQSIAYVMSAYSQQSGNNVVENIDLKSENCLKWAKALIHHGTEVYAHFGKQYYFEIKEESGKDEPHCFDFSNLEFEIIPPIKEITENIPSSLGLKDNNLNIDPSLLLYEHEYIMKGRQFEESSRKKIYLFGPNAAVFLFARGLYVLCKNSQIDKINDWEKQIQIAYQYFTYAWSIADDSCEINEKEGKIILKRNFYSKQDNESENNKYRIKYDFNEEASIRDLYPRRLGEIADLGKIFASVCQTILLTLNLQAVYLDNIKILLDNKLQSVELSNSDILNQQGKFNTHLSIYLDHIKNIFADQRLMDLRQKSGASNVCDENIQHFRNKLVQLVFSNLIKPPEENEISELFNSVSE